MESLFLDTLTNPWLLSIVLAIVFFASIVQFGLGMGFGLTAAPLLAVVDPQLVPAPALFLGCLTASVGAWRECDQIAWRELGIGILGRSIGIMIAALILAILPAPQFFEIVFGLLIGLAVLLSLIGWTLSFSNRNLTAVGIVSGVMGTITSVGAPPMAMIYQSRDAMQARPTLAAFFAIGCAMSLLGLYAAGWANFAHFLAALKMLPAVIAGFIVSGFMRGKFDRRYRRNLLMVSAIAAMVLVVRGLQWA